MRRLFSPFRWAILVAFIFAFTLFPLQSTHALASQQNTPPEPPLFVPHDETGFATFIGAGEGKPISLPGAVLPSMQAEDRAAQYLEAYGDLFGIRDAAQELTLLKKDVGEATQALRYQQVYQGVPILAGELILNLDARGGMRSLSGEVSPDLALDVIPTISAQDAQATALGVVAKAQGVTEESLQVSSAELWIYDEQILRPSSRPAELVWRMEVSSTTGAPLRELVLVNAQRGGVSLHFNQVDTLWAELGLQEEDVTQPTPEPDVTVIESTPEHAAQDSTPLIGGTIWYVSTAGDDLNDCLSPATPCATIQAAVDKAAYNDTVYIAGGIYTDTGDAVVTSSTRLFIFGGWDVTFSTQSEITIIDGEGVRRGINLTMWNSVISNLWVKRGYTTGDGGGIWAKATITIQHTTISDSIAEGDGGGLYLSLEAPGEAYVVNSTFSGNISGGRGGGISIDNPGSDKSVYLINNTIVNNTANKTGGGIFSEESTTDISIINSILYDDHALNSEGTETPGHSCDIYQPVISYSIIENKEGCAGTKGSILYKTGPILQDLDPATGVYELYVESPAIDNGDDFNCQTTDQLGINRPVDGDGSGTAECDIGAVEAVNPPPAPPRVASEIEILDGNNQTRRVGEYFWNPVIVRIADQYDYSIEGVEVLLEAPDSGSSISFGRGGPSSLTVYSDPDGLLPIPTIFANGEPGIIQVLVTISGTTISASFELESYIPGYLYVSRAGNNSNDCRTPATACRTLQAAEIKADPMDVIFVTGEVYFWNNTTNSNALLYVYTPVEISGGWSLDFQNQDGFSILDGLNFRRLISEVTDYLVIDHLWIKNGYASTSDGAGLRIHGCGDYYITNSVFTGNNAGVGSAINIDSSYACGFANLLIQNSTFANNHASTSSGAVLSQDDGVSTRIENSTIVGNHGESLAGAILLDGLNSYTSGSYLTIKNSILTGNTGNNGESNCETGYGRLQSGGNNIIGVVGSECDFVLDPSDQIEIDPMLLDGIDTLGFFPLAKGSPAIDAGSPLYCFPEDVRGLQRPFDGDGDNSAICDIGAFEYSGTESVAAHVIHAGDKNFVVEVGSTLITPFEAVALGPNYGQVAGAEITFTAPAAGASGVFSDSGTNTTTVIADANGRAVSPDYTANGVEGFYDVIAFVPGGITSDGTHVQNWTNHLWYVSSSGDNANDCLSPGTPCRDISAVYEKPSFWENDEIRVGIGNYVYVGSTVNEPVLSISKSMNLSGGWNDDFTEQIGYSTIDGQGSFPTVEMENVDLENMKHVAMDHFIFTGGYIWGEGFNFNLSDSKVTNVFDIGVYLRYFESVSFNRVEITKVLDSGSALYILDGTTFSLKNSVIYDNEATGLAIDRVDSSLIENSIFFDNHDSSTSSSVGGLEVGTAFDPITLDLNNITIMNNSGETGGIAIYNVNADIRNSIIMGNNGSVDGECNTYLNSLGYNIFSELGDCIETLDVGDQVGVSLMPGLVDNYGGTIPSLPFLGYNPAIDAGNPEIPGSTISACNPTGQRGFARPIDGDGDGQAICDIGAVEFTGPGSTPVYLIYLGENYFVPKGVTISEPIKVYVLDEYGSQVPGANVTFTSQSLDTSVTFIDTGNSVNIVTTDQYGTADSGLFTAGSNVGTSTITISVGGTVEDIHVKVFVLPTIETYSMNNDSNEEFLPGTFKCDLSTPGCTQGADEHADNAQLFAIGTIEYYLDHHGRRSIDDAGMDVISSVHFDTGYTNAFWNGEQMVYGDGKNYPNADDVVAHELTHGVTESESNLFYYYQSGAISESLSDLWGEFFDLSTYSYSDEPYHVWTIGEVVGGIRSMDDPTAYNDPDKMTSTYYDLGDGDFYANDNGGVHTNSGVNNKAVYLMTEGDAFNGYTVTGIGMEKVAAIYYEVQTHLLTSGADYKDLYYAVQQACTNLIGGAAGISAADCVEVQKALDAVEMSQDPVTNFNPDPPTCPAGLMPNDIFYDGFESGTSQWQIMNHASLGDTWGRVTGAAAEGNYSIWGPDFQGVNVGALYFQTYAQTENIPIPAGNVYLHFEHNFGFEGPNYDGGIVQYSVNNGGWQDLNPLLVAGQGYNGVIESAYQNPLGGSQGFVDDSHGYVSSKYDLSGQAGKNLRFRWVIGTDEGWYDWGWFLDEVRVYTCVQAGTELLTNNSIETELPADWMVSRGIEPVDGRDCSEQHSGSCSWQLNGNGAEKRVIYHYRPDGVAGDTFDFSIWRKGENTGGAGYMVALVRIIHKDGSFQEEMINFSGGTVSAWEQRSASFSALEDYQLITVSVTYKKPGGTLWVDDVSLVKNTGPELMVNPSFELSMPEGWSYARDHEVADGRDCTVWHTGSCAWEMNGNGIEKRIVYHHRPDGSAGDAFSFSIWRKGLNTGGAGYMVALIRIIHQDGSFQEEMVNLSGGDLAAWEQRTASITANENYQLITVSVAYKKPGGTLWVDDINMVQLP